MNKNEYVNQLKFEHELINRRVTWLLTSQSIFFATYGFVYEKTPTATATVTASFLKTLSVIGATTSMLCLVGILASFAAKFCTWKKLQKNPKYEYEPFGVNTPITFIGFIPDFTLPIVFIIGWRFLYCLAPS